MIIIMKPQATEEQILSLTNSLAEEGMQVQRNAGVDCTVLGVLGDVASLDPHDFLIQPGVERVHVKLGFRRFRKMISHLLFGNLEVVEVVLFSFGRACL